MIDFLNQVDHYIISSGCLPKLVPIEQYLPSITIKKWTTTMKAMIKQKYLRPSWDQYFMEIANTVSKRATCDRGRSGCVIARNRSCW